MDVAAMVKQEYNSDAENGETNHRRLAMRKVDSDCAPTMLSIKSLLQKLVRTSLARVDQASKG